MTRPESTLSEVRGPGLTHRDLPKGQGSAHGDKMLSLMSCTGLYMEALSFHNGLDSQAVVPAVAHEMARESRFSNLTETLTVCSPLITVQL